MREAELGFVLQELGIGSKSESEDWGEEGEEAGFAVRQRCLLVPPNGVRSKWP